MFAGVAIDEVENVNDAQVLVLAFSASYSYTHAIRSELISYGSLHPENIPDIPIIGIVMDHMREFPNNFELLNTKDYMEVDNREFPLIGLYRLAYCETIPRPHLLDVKLNEQQIEDCVKLLHENSKRVITDKKVTTISKPENPENVEPKNKGEEPNQ